MRSSDLSFLYTVETADLFAGKACRISHHPGCGCAPELVHAWLGGAGTRHYADPMTVTHRFAARLRAGVVPWSMSPTSYARETLALVAGVAAVLWVAQGPSVAAASVCALVWVLAGPLLRRLAARVRRSAGIAPDTVVAGEELDWAPDLSAVMTAYAAVLEARVHALRRCVGRDAAAEFACEAGALLFRAAKAARAARMLGGGATELGHSQTRPLETYFDTSVAPPRPRYELLRTPEGTYHDPLLGGVAGHLRICVDALDELGALMGWSPHAGHLPAGPR